MTTLYDLNVAATPAIKIGNAISAEVTSSGNNTVTAYTVPAGHYAVIQIHGFGGTTRTFYSSDRSSWAVYVAGIRFYETSSTISEGYQGPIYLGPGQTVFITTYASGSGAQTSAWIRLSGVSFEQT